MRFALKVLPKNREHVQNTCLDEFPITIVDLVRKFVDSFLRITRHFTLFKNYTIGDLYNDIASLNFRKRDPVKAHTIPSNSFTCLARSGSVLHAFRTVRQAEFMNVMIILRIEIVVRPSF